MDEPNVVGSLQKEPKCYGKNSKMIDFRQKVRISDQVLSQEMDGETVLLDLQSENYFGLDEVGTRMWQLLQQYGDLQTVLTTILDGYEVEPERLEKDLDDLLQKLLDAGLITLAPKGHDEETT